MSTTVGAGRRTGAVGRRLRQVYAAASRAEQAGYVVGLALMTSGLFHAGVWLVDGGSLTGPVSWRKAITFGLSFGATLMSVVWAAGYVRLPARTRSRLVGVFTAACVLEVWLVTWQAWRRVPSHFNMETGFDTAVSRTLAVGGGAIVFVITWLTIAALRPQPALTPSLRLAVRAGFVALEASMLTGAAMIARGVREVSTGHQETAYHVGGFLKPEHFALMHGVLALPVLALCLRRVFPYEARRTGALRWVLGAYAAGVLGLVAWTLAT